MKFDELRRFYSENFSIGHLNPPEANGHTSFERKLILISLINHIYSKTKLKHPDTTHWEIVKKLSKNLALDDDFLKGLAIVCEDFGYGVDTYPTYGLKGQDIVKECVSILKSYMPF